MKITYNFRTRSLLILLASLGFFITGNSQNAYELAWKALDDANVDEAIAQFEAALKDPACKENALLCLTMLYERQNKKKEATEVFETFFDLSPDPFPALYALWFEEGAVGLSFKKKPSQLKMLQKLEKNKANKGKLDAACDYRLSTHYRWAFDKSKAQKYFNKINYIDNWLLLGPFDNVMNSGYDKDFGVLSNPDTTARFTSRYGAEIGWFKPATSGKDGYIFKEAYFLGDNSMIYGQTFINSPEDQELILKFGYTGTLKLWLNDSLIFWEQEPRETDIDYFRIKCRMNKGFNRILVQSGDTDLGNTNFTIRLTDTENNPIWPESSCYYRPFQKGVEETETIPHFAVRYLEEQAEKTDDLLYEILLAKSYFRSKELEKAESILEMLYKEHPKNYLVLLNMVLLSTKANNNTNQNKYYDLFQEIYAEDRDVLKNKIDKYYKEGNKLKVKEYSDLYLSRYYDEYLDISFKIVLASMDEDVEKLLKMIDDFSKSFPDDNLAQVSKYKMEKSYLSNPVKANSILEKFLENNFSHQALMELVNNYQKEGKPEKAMGLLQKYHELFLVEVEPYSSMVNLLTRQSRYKEAIEICQTILQNRPSDFNTLSDLAFLNKAAGNNEKAIFYYNESLRYFPFSFEVNENIRELKGLTKIQDMIPEIDPAEKIASYNSSFVPPVKNAYDIVWNAESLVIFKSKAIGRTQEYVLKMNDESAIEEWQNISFNTTSTIEYFIKEAKTIKQSGEKIDAERNNGEVVFINLEVGDYIFVSYLEKQYNGGKSSVFISDVFSLNSFTPVYEEEYNLYVEDGVSVIDTCFNTSMVPEISQKEGFEIYKWRVNSPEVVKNESNALPFYDIAQTVHIAVNYSWKDIVQWFSDLSTYQAMPDYTIKTLAGELFDGREKDLSDEEKAKVIYNFVAKNINYSSIDFRQSGYIPQKASRVYHSRLGDCKDVSTLFVSLARVSGLEAELVLVNTSDNGQNSVLLPSLNFNHCIVKVHLEKGDKFLELTDPDLPFGYLYNSHNGASILEIPTVNNISEDIHLTYLTFNEGYKNEIFRHSKVNITDDFKMKIRKENINTGIYASELCKTYFYSDEKEQKDNLKQRISNDFNSALTLDALDFKKLEPRLDTAIFSFDITVDNDVLKLGSFRSVKVPFSDILVRMNIFEDSERTLDFDFVNYEDVDRYEETIEIGLPEGHSFVEIPEDVHLEYKGCYYNLNFERNGSDQLKVHRVYTVNRQNVKPEEFSAFKVFMSKLNEAENTHLLFK